VIAALRVLGGAPLELENPGNVFLFAALDPVGAFDQARE
jgi:hypothetical protein